MNDFNIQFNIMDGLYKVRKDDFIKTFINTYPKSKYSEIAKDLTALNKDNRIILYHNKGFLIDWGNLRARKNAGGFIDLGRFVSSFYIDCPSEFITVGGKYRSDANRYRNYTAIHPNIYNKFTNIRLPTVKDFKVIKICLQVGQINQIENFVRNGHIYGAIQIVQNMFDENQEGDGVWGLLEMRKCPICDEQIALEQEKCFTCENLD